MPPSAEAFCGRDCDYCGRATLVSEYASVDVRLCLPDQRERHRQLTFCSQEHLDSFVHERRLLDFSAADAAAADRRTATWAIGSCLLWLAVAAVVLLLLGYVLVTWLG